MTAHLVVDPRLAGLPAELAAEAAPLLADHAGRVAEWSAVLLPAGGITADRFEVQDGSRPVRWETCGHLLDLARQWADDAATTVAELVRLADGALDGAARVLLTLAGELLSAPHRARVAVLAAYIAPHMVDPALAYGTRVAEDGTTSVAGVPVLLTGAAVAAAPWADPRVTLSIGQGSDPTAVAAELRRLADAVATSGEYPAAVSHR
ncbi:hypothetical protein [Pseudofrankia sp. BMG5.37]|uniref:hypothetical protein n=1 Tax=Pseudofrankia sp. BMG5.37 TaxID=3050035 RepID=UPI00289472C2|nr:hypothetical protein [Pseudofrankia sp. BMG5.37]MDT3438351.1 hypothetical protein [Pseudofrankia sp. BMG5.37]